MFATLLMDVEDLIDPDSDDIAKLCADILVEEGVQATLCIVGEKARLLEKRLRRDVITTLLQHDIGFHTDFHSVHPTIAEFLKDKSWEEGIVEAIKHEAPGVEAIERVFGVLPSCWGGPGNTWGPQICEAMRQLGVPSFVYGFTSVPEEQVHRFEGIIAYPEGHYFSDSVFHLDSSVERHLERVTSGLQSESNSGIFWSQIFIGHPTRIQHTCFWDEIFANGVNPDVIDWKPAEKKRPLELEQTLENFRKIVRAIRNLPNIKLRTIREMNAILSPLPSFPLNSSEQEEVWEPIKSKLEGMVEWPILPRDFEVSSICNVMQQRLPQIERFALPA